jgi:hypothetical protein
MDMTKRVLEGNGYSLYEVEAYGPEDSAMTTNLLLGGTAIASSEHSNNLASYVVDENMFSRWESEWKTDPQWLEIILPGANTVPVSRIVLKWEKAYAQEYYVIVSTTPRAIHTIIDTHTLEGWIQSMGGPENATFTASLTDFGLKDGQAGKTVGFHYDVANGGYTIITKKVDPNVLSGTMGIRFFYRGNGAPSTIELKLILMFPNDQEDTVYGVLWNAATETGDQWIQVDVLYSDFTCWFSEKNDNCQRHGTHLDLTVVDRLDLVVSCKPEDGSQCGSGDIAFEDIQTILPVSPNP